MSGSLHAWYSCRELESLADRGVTVSGELPVSELKRLLSLLASDTGSVSASLGFRQRGASWVGLTLDYRATVELECQRCLEPFRYEWAESVDIALVLDTAAPPRGLPAGYEPFELEEKGLRPAQLIEDELIVAIPLVAKHSRPSDCGSLARGLVESAGES